MSIIGKFAQTPAPRDIVSEIGCVYDQKEIWHYCAAEQLPNDVRVKYGFPVFRIYEAQCVINGKRYIGLTTVSISKRRKQHLNAAARGSERIFHAAIRKYGAHNFRWDEIIVVNCNTLAQLKKAEIYLISLYNTEYPNGYNGDSGGGGGAKPCQLVRKKISDKKKGRAHTADNIANMKTGIKKWHEKPETQAMMRRIGLARRGAKLPDDVVNKIRLANLGKKRTPAQRAAQSAQKKGVKLSPTHRQALADAWARTETKERRIAAIKAAVNRPGAKEKRRKVWLGRKHKPESREKMRQAAKGKVPWNKGIRMSPESRANVSAAAKQRGARGRRQDAAPELWN